MERRKKIPEVHYRASRICRILGNPTAYEILHLLRNNMMRPEEIASALGVSMSTVSMTLRSLRQIDLVRYIVKWKKRIYWIKDEKVLTVMDELEKLVKRIKFRDY
ncbi:MAG: ArsR family transcriptional regulator [candidate division WOR-3 bacterium]